ncbi:Ribulose-1,5-bisphosphate carboxylase/oxygenase (RuBisCO) small subunit [Candidatus Methylacidithermus pantelleriae]|uniref:Ribulose bisphosphate carboxylase small subunit n=1 Tax=Candidatus Methylacidithermus pantelleriae TaxID=2744239 RepID=A0A8J2BJY7_9BACT|nr:Ribulose-1,5-bisphosphate carboxylase/oxygenase (RuBisCO) small subunit [Candidatus Methylacidithermus pantelleriae]
MIRVTQGTFSYLPDFTDEEIRAQVEYCIRNRWAVSIEHTDDIHPRNVYWEMYGLPFFDLTSADPVMERLAQCRREFPNHYIRVLGFDSRRTRATILLSFIVQRPKEEPGFRMERLDYQDRQIKYSLHPYAKDRPRGYAGNEKGVG